jgi:hypothetical protein
VVALALTLVASSVEVVLTSPAAPVALADEKDDEKKNKNRGEDGETIHELLFEATQIDVEVQKKC